VTTLTLSARQSQPPFKRLKAEPIRTASAEAVPTLRSNQSTSGKAETPTQTKKVAVRDGSKYPEHRTSTLDVNEIPIWQPKGKLITEVDLDLDIALETKPWRVAGTDPTDFFNYGFDEFTWVQYCLRQQQMRDSVSGLKSESKQFEAMLSGQMPPGAAPPPAVGGMPMMPGMPDPNNPDMMNAMMNMMQAQGLTDPSQMDFNAFMQQMGGMQGMPGMPGAPSGPGQFGQNPQQQQQQSAQSYGGGYGGQNMHQQGPAQGYGQQQQSQSPFPGQQQHQAQGYGGGTPQPQQNGPAQGQSLEGYSAQQLALMQQGGQAGGGNHAGGGGRGRGRGRRW